MAANRAQYIRLGDAQEVCGDHGRQPLVEEHGSGFFGGQDL
jgi:hypothetical protein